MGRRASNDRGSNYRRNTKTSGVPRPKDKANSLYNGFFRYSDRRMGLFVVDVTPLSGDTGKIIAAKLTLYSGDSEEYYCFITPEAYTSLKEWIDFHSSYGEKITGESWVMRNIWQATNIDYGARLGLATCPKKLKCSGIKRLLERALWEQGLRHPLSDGKKRHEWKAAHGFRKFYKTHAEQVMKPINVEITMGYNIGVSASYYRPTEREVLEDYLKAIPPLTVNSNELLLQDQLKELTEKTKNDEYLIKGKLVESSRSERA